jgi:hypothetical protein
MINCQRVFSLFGGFGKREMLYVMLEQGNEDQFDRGGYLINRSVHITVNSQDHPFQAQMFISQLYMGRYYSSAFGILCGLISSQT